MSILRWVFNVFLVILVAELHMISSGSYSSDIINQQQLDKVSSLPGQNFNVSFAHYSGYITVNNESGRAFFYWFFEAEEDPSSKPLLLWLNGGPGCSSIAFGLAEEIGPFHIEKDGKTLYLNPFSWNRVANILFLDSPVGVGFSYSNTSSDLSSNGDKRTAADNLKFLQEWFERFPQYKGNEFYISGESYAGHYVPQLSHAIVQHNQKNEEEAINFKGFMVGNALTDDFHDHLGLFQFMWSVGMISDQTYKQLNNSYFMHGSSSQNYVPIFKLVDEEPNAEDNLRKLSLSTDGEGLTKGLQIWEGKIREVATYILWHSTGGSHLICSKEKGFAGVLPTVMVQRLHSGFHYSKGLNYASSKLGSPKFMNKWVIVRAWAVAPFLGGSLQDTCTC